MKAEVMNYRFGDIANCLGIIAGFKRLSRPKVGHANQIETLLR